MHSPDLFSTSHGGKRINPSDKQPHKNIYLIVGSFSVCFETLHFRDEHEKGKEV